MSSVNSCAGESVDEALSRMHELHGEALRRYLSRVLQCDAAAQDVAQEAWVRLLRYRPQLEPTRSRGYLFQVALNIARNRFAAKRTHAEIPSSLEWESDLESDAPDPERVAEAREAVGIVADEIERLPPRCREVFLMHRIEGLTHEAIAEILQISRSMVEKHMIKALDRCRRRMDSVHAEAW
jgi:RNA polymerase sigma-70 factor (ECF subfamily)